MTSQPNPPPPRGVHRIGVTVPGLDAATRFLTDGLSAKVAYDGLNHISLYCDDIEGSLKRLVDGGG